MVNIPIQLAALIFIFIEFNLNSDYGFKTHLPSYIVSLASLTKLQRDIRNIFKEEIVCSDIGGVWDARLLSRVHRE